MACVFCDDTDVQNRTIVRTAYSWAVPTNIPITPMHTLVLPIRHVATFDELTDEERDDLLALRARIASALKKSGAEGFNYAWNEGALAGQSIEHFHLHIVPRTTGDTGITQYEPRVFLYRPGSREASPESELRAVAEELRASVQ